MDNFRRGEEELNQRRVARHRALRDSFESENIRRKNFELTCGTSMTTRRKGKRFLFSQRSKDGRNMDCGGKRTF